MDIEALRTFVEVADAGGVSPAARRLGVSKSIVSRHLARLEADLGVQLLARSARGASLTDIGIVFRGHAARACAEIDAARDMILPDGDLCGRLRVAVPLTFGQTHLAPVLADMARRHPQLHIHTSCSDRFVDLIAEGFDCAIRIGYLHDSDLMARHVGPIYGSLVASPDYIEAHGSPRSRRSSSRIRFSCKALNPWQLTDGNEIISVHPQGRFKADNGTALVAAALAGLGIAWLPNGIMHDHLASGALVVVMTEYPPPPAAIYVIRPPSQQPLRKVRVLTEMLIACFGQSSDVPGASPV